MSTQLSDDLRDTLRGLGISYRQFDYWICRGLVPIPEQERNPGQGFSRRLTATEVEHLRLMAELVQAGVKPDTASQLATAIRRGEPARLGPYMLTRTSDTATTGDAA